MQRLWLQCRIQACSHKKLKDLKQEKNSGKMLSQVQTKVKRRQILKKKTSLMDQISILMQVILIVTKKCHLNSQKKWLSISSTLNDRIELKSIECKITSNLLRLWGKKVQLKLHKSKLRLMKSIGTLKCLSRVSVIEKRSMNTTRVFLIHKRVAINKTKVRGHFQKQDPP